MEIYAPIVKAKDFRRVVPRSRENLEFGRRVAEHQVRRLSDAVVSDTRVAVHFAVSTVHAHFESDNHVGIFRKHRSQLLYMAQHPLVFRRHIAAAIVPWVITNAHNSKAIVLADVVKRRLQNVQSIFCEVLTLAPCRVLFSAGRINPQPRAAAEFRNFSAEV